MRLVFVFHERRLGKVGVQSHIHLLKQNQECGPQRQCMIRHMVQTTFTRALLLRRMTNKTLVGLRSTE